MFSDLSPLILSYIFVNLNLGHPVARLTCGVHYNLWSYIVKNIFYCLKNNLTFNVTDNWQKLHVLEYVCVPYIMWFNEDYMVILEWFMLIMYCLCDGTYLEENTEKSIIWRKKESENKRKSWRMLVHQALHREGRRKARGIKPYAKQWLQQIMRGIARKEEKKELADRSPLASQTPHPVFP